MTFKVKHYITVFFLVFAFSIFLPDVSLSQNVTTYEQAIQKGDALFSSGKLMDAKAYYQMALKYKKNDPHAKKKINEIIDKMSARMELEDEYYDLIDKADLYFDQNALDKALEYYQKALQVIQDDDYAKKRIREIYTTKANEQERLSNFQKDMAQGDDLLAQNRFDEAIAKYRDAQKLYPAKPAPGEKIKTAQQLKAEYEARLEQFNEKVTEAERYLLINKFANALKLYEEAQKLFPDNAEVAARIKELTPKAQNQIEYEKLVEEADNLYINKNYGAAKERYAEAAKLWPENNYAADMISRINEQLSVQMKDLENNYDLAVASGDSLFQVEDYESAKAQYNLALTLKPDEQYPKSKLEVIDGIYAKRKEEMQKQYASIVSTADSLLNALALQDAKKQYEKALSIRPDDNYPKSKLKEIEAKEAELAEAQKLKMQYDAIIAEADKLYKDGHYDLAIKKYEEAQVLGAISDYPEARIKEIQMVMANAQKAKEINDSYNKQVILATRLKQQGNLEEARKAFVAASEIKPAEQMPKEQIAEIDKLIFDKQQQEQINKKYEASMKSADSLMALKQWDEAINMFRYAGTLKPEETAPNTQITKIETIKANIEKAAKKQKAYENFIAQGDKLIKEEKYQEAKVQFQQALDEKPNEKYPRERITFIDQKLQELAAQRERQYKESVTKADNFYEQGNFQDALLNYKTAANIKPDNLHCKQRIKECNSVIEEIHKKRKAEFDLAVADADKLYAAKIYDKAIKNYRKAQNILPDEAYPQEMIEKITKYIDENSIVDVIKEPTLIKKGENKKYTFEPVPINVRKHNYFLLKAKSPTGEPVKLMITYGSSKGKNGGFVINLQEGKDVNDYLIRVGNQYKWFSDDNNWISILPQTGDVEIELLRISKLN
jgi:tetratricopeptide (TPR) repeat protein